MTSAHALDQRLDPLIRRLASNHDGEVVATVCAIRRVLEKRGQTLNDLADRLSDQPQKSNSKKRHRKNGGGNPAVILAKIRRLAKLGDLNEWEAGFAASIVDQVNDGRRLTDKQLEKIDAILAERE